MRGTRTITTENYQGGDRRRREGFDLKHDGYFFIHLATLVVSLMVVAGSLFYTYNTLTNQISSDAATKTQQISSLKDDVRTVQDIVRSDQNTVTQLSLKSATQDTRLDRDEHDLAATQSSVAAVTQSLVTATTQLTHLNDVLDNLTSDKRRR